LTAAARLRGLYRRLQQKKLLHRRGSSVPSFSRPLANCCSFGGIRPLPQTLHRTPPETKTSSSAFSTDPTHSSLEMGMHTYSIRAQRDMCAH
jgi:hypothetical protein